MDKYLTETVAASGHDKCDQSKRRTNKYESNHCFKIAEYSVFLAHSNFAYFSITIILHNSSFIR